MHPVRFRPHSYKSNNNDYKLSLSLFTFFLGITITLTAEGVTKKTKHRFGFGDLLFTFENFYLRNWCRIKRFLFEYNSIWILWLKT